MAIFYPLGSGSNVDLDVITATAEDLLSPKVIVDKDGNPLTGTMVNHGAVNQSLAINGSYTIPKGYHNGSGKVSQSIPTQGAKTITPGANQQRVAAGRYLTGAITVPGFSMPAANLIKKGAKITIYGRSVTGTWEGYVPTANMPYNRGAFGPGFSIQGSVQPKGSGFDRASISYMGNAMRISGDGGAFYFFNLYPMMDVDYINLSVIGTAARCRLGIGTNLPNYTSGDTQYNDEYATKYIENTINDQSEITLTLDVRSITNQQYIFFGGYTGGRYMDITRVWFS